MSIIVWWLEDSLAWSFFVTEMKTDLFQSCVHCWVFQICWHVECSTSTVSPFRIWNSSAGICGITESMNMNSGKFGRYWRTGKPGPLQSMLLKRVGHNSATEQQHQKHYVKPWGHLSWVSQYHPPLLLSHTLIHTSRKASLSQKQILETTWNVERSLSFIRM